MINLNTWFNFRFDLFSLMLWPPVVTQNPIKHRQTFYKTQQYYNHHSFRVLCLHLFIHLYIYIVLCSFTHTLLIMFVIYTFHMLNQNQCNYSSIPTYDTFDSFDQSIHNNIMDLPFRCRTSHTLNRVNNIKQIVIYNKHLKFVRKQFFSLSLHYFCFE